MLNLLGGGGGPGKATVIRWVDEEGYQKIVGNEIGTPGEAGFGQGICPPDSVPDGFVPLTGYADPTNVNYGNYRFRDGSIMVYIPRFLYKIGTGSNGLSVNVVDIKPWDYYPTEVEANTAGYVTHLAFYDGGGVTDGFFIDKYMCSKNALGSGYVASSIVNGDPISTHADHNPIADLTACSANAYYESITAAHARDGANGSVNSSSIFFVGPRDMFSALALLSMAHGQAATGTTNCAWYDGTGITNYPKGCNDNALGDVDDATVSYTSDGYSNCGKTGSGVPFAKTTHNGQACGIADLNGLMWEVNIGVGCIATSASVTAATQANPCQLEVVGHGKSTGNYVLITGIAGMTELNDKIFTITVVDTDNFTLDGVDSSAFAAYTSGGTATFGTFYRKKDSVRYRDFTAGNTLATDHWGATGIAAMMDEYDMVFKTAYPNNGFGQLMGSGANQVLSDATSGNGAVLTSLGIPHDADGIDTSGTNLFGRDYFYQYIRNELCLSSGGAWSSSSNAGVCSSFWIHYRTSSSTSGGFRCACYPKSQSEV